MPLSNGEVPRTTSAPPKVELDRGKVLEADVAKKAKITETASESLVLRSQLYMPQEIDHEKNAQVAQASSKKSLDESEHSLDLSEASIEQTAHDDHPTTQVFERPSQELSVTKEEERIEEIAKNLQEAERNTIHDPEASDKEAEYAQTKYEDKDSNTGVLLLPVDEKARRVELSEAKEPNSLPICGAEHEPVQMTEVQEEVDGHEPGTEEIEQGAFTEVIGHQGDSLQPEKVAEYIALVELAEEYEDAEPLTIESLIPACNTLDNMKDESPADYVALGQEASEKQESTTMEPVLIEQIADYVERNKIIEKEQQEKALTLIEEIKTISQEVIELKFFESTESKEHLEHVEARLEEACTELFEAIGIEYDQEIVKQFVQTIMKQEIAKKLSVLQAGVELDEEGTHERKHFTLRDIVQGFRKEGQTLHLLLGKCAVAVSAS